MSEQSMTPNPVPNAFPQHTPVDPHHTSEASHRRAGGGKRKPLSCLACRNHKLRCDRRVPCGTCTRYNRESQCRLNPAPLPPPRRRKRAPARASARVPASPSLVAPPQDRSPCAPRQDQNSHGLPAHTSTVTESTRDHASSAVYIQDISPANHVLGQSSRADAYTLGDASSLTTFDMQRPIWTSLRQLLADAARGQESTLPWNSVMDFHYRRQLAQQQLTSVLPSRSQCDLLLNFFLEHINWMFQTVHEPSLRREYALFWEEHASCTNFIWMSLLFTILSVSALHVPLEAVDVVGLPRQAIRSLGQVWHHASRHALKAGDCESKPCLVQLQTFSITQLYWYATNQVEVINSHLGAAVKTAHALRLDRDTAPSECFEDELRHRLWWDLVDSDMFQSACLDRPPLIRLSFPGVPLPLNCNDSDLDHDLVQPRPISEATEMSMNIFRAQLFRILNRDYFKRETDIDRRNEDEPSSSSDPHSSRGASYEDVVALDKQVLDLVDNLPWYLQLDLDGGPPRLAEPLGERIMWQQYILRTCINTQRIRMYRQFLHPRVGKAWDNCVSAAQDMMNVYGSLRTQMSLTSHQKFLPQAYQVFSVAVTVVAMLLVEGSLPIQDVYQQVRDMTKDLGMLERQGCHVPIAMRGTRVLGKMLDLCEARSTMATSTSPEEAQVLVPDIAIILGGERVTRAYVNRLQDAAATDNIGADVTLKSLGPPGSCVGHGHVEANSCPKDNTNRPIYGDNHADATAFESSSVEAWNSVDDIGNLPMEGNVDPALFTDDVSLMGLLNWDMTGLLVLDPSEAVE